MAMLPRPSASLYCGGLSSDTTEANLYEIFNQVGPVASIRICRDSATRRSLGYGYINFHNAVDAERALDTLNYSSIRGKACRLMWSQRDPSLRKSGVGNIFIKNLDKSIDNKALHDTFSAFGNVISCNIMTDENGQSKGFGFVHFESAEAAEAAIEKVNGMLLNEKIAYVGHHIPKKERSSKSDELKRNFTNIFIKNLDESVDDQALAEMFKPFGNIVSAVVMKDEASKSKGFAFVNFSSHEEAAAACDEMNEKEHNTKKLFVGRAQKKSERKEELSKKYEAQRMERLNKYQGVNLFVKNLDDGIDEEKLRNEFGAYGTITSAVIQSDDKGNSKGFGFVCFSSPEEATKAVTELNGKMLGSKPIYVALAQRKEVRRQQLEAQYAHRAQLRMAQQSGVLGGPMYGQPFYYNGGAPMGVPPPRGQMPPGAFGYPQGFPAGRPRWGSPNQQQGAPQPGSPPNGQPNGNPEMMGGYANGSRPNRPPQMGNRSRPGQASGAPRPGGPGGQPMPNGVPVSQGGAGAPMQGGQQSRKGNYRYTSNVRNRIDQSSSPAPQNGNNVSASMPSSSPEPLTLSALASMPEDQQKNLLGERLYVSIAEKQPVLAGKITGMLLDMDNSELLHLLDSAEALAEKVEEALAVLNEHEQGATA